MSRRLLNLAGCCALVAALASVAFAQTTVTTTQTQAVQNPDGSWTVIQYPTDKEVVVDLTPGTTFTSAHGHAKIIRRADGTNIALDLSGLPADATALNLYAVDPFGKVTLLGPVTISNGVAQQTFTTPLDRFMLVMSPDANLTAYAPDTAFAFRSAVPAVVVAATFSPEALLDIGTTA